MSMKKKLTAILIIAGMMSFVSCSESESPSTSETSSAETTTVEMITEAETEATSAEEVTEEISEEVETEAESEGTETEENGHVLTNAELLSLINNTFGMVSDGTFESDLQVAQDWDVVDADAITDSEAEITAELLVSASMRATGMVTGESSMDEIINLAVEKGVIESDDLSAVDLSKAVDVVNKAYDAWINQDFDTELNVELADGVVDLTGTLSAEECTVSDGTIILPSTVAEQITAGTVFIVPDDTVDGTAYKADAVTDNGDGTITVASSPAGFEEVYGSIN
ncbi:MAG: hypothetical protein J6B74_06390 [Ruminococcus sp.]|nr:hypothetical protein [Ruminococcus sp.]